MPAKAAALTLNETYRIPRHPAKKRLPAEWLPQQHGAWAMLFLPFIVGVVLRVQEGHFHMSAVPLLLLWLSGYFAFHALSLWLKARNKARYVRPVQVYAGVSAVLGAIVLWLAPGLLEWAAIYAPLLGIGLWQAWKKDESALLGRSMTVIAACLICAVTFSDGLRDFVGGVQTEAAFQRAAAATLTLTAYFLGTIFYVKTMIRERGQKGFLMISVAYHVLITILAALAALRGWVGAAPPLFLLATTVRALVVPLMGPMRGKSITPKQVGIMEAFFVLALFFILI